MWVGDYDLAAQENSTEWQERYVDALKVAGNTTAAYADTNLWAVQMLNAEVCADVSADFYLVISTCTAAGWHWSPSMCLGDNPALRISQAVTDGHVHAHSA